MSSLWQKAHPDIKKKLDAKIQKIKQQNLNDEMTKAEEWLEGKIDGIVANQNTSNAMFAEVLLEQVVNALAIDEEEDEESSSSDIHQPMKSTTSSVPASPPINVVMEKDFATIFQAAMEAKKAGNYAEATKLATIAAEGGYAEALDYKGHCHYQGYIPPQDYKKAVKCFRQAAEKGNASSKEYLGFCYSLGQGVEVDQTIASAYFESAANLGRMESQRRIGIRYRDGVGVPQIYLKLSIILLWQPIKILS
jgi:TPR repeat protein